MVFAGFTTTANAEIYAGGVILKSCYDVTDTRYYDFQYQCKYAKSGGVTYKGPWCYQRGIYNGQAFLSRGSCP